MTIQVVRHDGSHEFLTLTEPLIIVRGKHQNCIITSTRMEHFFTQDGVYDGWAMDISRAGFTMLPDADEFIQAIESEREIMPIPTDRQE